jgi:hypothetical protein
MSRQKRVWLWLGLLVTLATAGIAGVEILWPRSPINQENFEKIQMGMSLQEVQDIFGRPPGDYSTAEVIVVGHGDPGSAVDRQVNTYISRMIKGLAGSSSQDPIQEWSDGPHNHRAWLSNSMYCDVFLDGKAIVRSKSFRFVRPLAASPWQHLCLCLGF